MKTLNVSDEVHDSIRSASNKTGLPINRLVELLVTVSLVAIIVTIGAINLSFMNKSLVRSEMDSLYSLCTYLQRKAMATNTKQVIQFDVINNSYAYDNVSRKLPRQIRFGFLPGVKGPPASARLLIQSPVSFKGKKIIFHPDGIIQPGTIYLVDDTKQSMYALSCSVAQVSYLRIYQYAGTWERL